jgi:hypothetical protein
LQVGQQRLAFAQAQMAAGEEGHGGILEAIYRRTLGFRTAADTPPGLTLAGYPKVLLLRYYLLYGLPAVGALAALLMLLLGQRRALWKPAEWPGEIKLVVTLLIAGSGWWLVMLQHSSVHAHVMRQGLAGYALLVALVLLRCWRSAKLPALGLMLALGYVQVEGLICNLRVHYQEGYQDERGRGGAGAIEMRDLSALRDIVPPGAVILTNRILLPQMRFWSERPVYAGVPLPLPGRDPATAATVLELSFNHLRELYGETLPPLYYVYRFQSPKVEVAFRDDELLRFLLTGQAQPGEAARDEAWLALEETWRTGQSTRALCPIVARVRRMLVLQADPLVPVLRRTYGARGYPTLWQFGPPR